MESLKKQAAKLLGEQKKYRRWIAVFLCLAIVVTTGTVAALKMNGQALSRKEKVLACAEEVHGHTAECYETDQMTGEQKLVCGYADYVVHTHNEECWGKGGELACTLPEIEAHTHEENCFREEQMLICGQEESQGHVHTEECRTLVCAQEESAGHVHTDECRTLVCGQEESAGHIHEDSCRTLSQGALVCTNVEEGHQHTDECYESVETITCGKEEGESSHTHTEACWNPQGCGLKEGSQAHAHTETCWNPEGCGLKEGEDGHTHTTECYEIRKTAACGKLELHTHVKTGENSCFDEEGKTVCGIPELKEHIHGEDCFLIVEEETDGTEQSSTEEEAAEDTEADAAEASESQEDISEEETSEAESSKEDESEADSSEEGESEADSSEEDESEADMEGSESTPVAGEDGKEYTLTAQGEDYTVTVTYGAAAKIPEGAELNVREILEGTEEYEDYYQQMLAAVKEESSADSEDEGEVEVSFARFFDITFMVNGEKIEPEAPVDIRVSYQDAIVFGEDETPSAVHFKRDGETEVLDADIADAGEGSDFTFTQDSFSVTSNVVISRAPKKKQQSLTKSIGNVTVTVSYEGGQSSDWFENKDSLQIEEITDSGQSGNNSYRKYLNNSQGAIKAKHEDELEVASARVFSIAVLDAAGNQKATNGNVKVEFSYHNSVKAEKAGSKALLLDKGESAEIISSEAVSAGEEITGFSATRSLAAAPNVFTAMVTNAAASDDIPNTGGDRNDTTSVHKDVSSYLQTEGKNEWQIVEGGYKGNNPGNKTLSANGDVRVQKNVIPTDTENEFLVYLSVDVKDVYEKFLDLATYSATSSSNNEAHGTVGTIVNNPTGNQAVKIGPKGQYTHGTFKLTLIDTKGHRIEKEYSFDSANNITMYIELADGRWLILATGITKNGDRGHTITLTEDQENLLEQTIAKVVTLGTVNDPMGPNIECLGIEGGDYRVEGTTWTPSEITWVPVAKANAQEDDQTVDGNGSIWRLNVAELVYRVRLKVENPGFSSCAECLSAGGTCGADSHKNAVNGGAVLMYDDGERVPFPDPYVRGLLYDYELIKKAQNSDGTESNLEGAVFAIEGTDKTATSDSQGKVLFTDMPWGTYKIREVSAPDGYEVSDESVSTVLCYTTNKEILESDAQNKLPQNMIPSGEKKIVYNKEKVRIIVEKIWEDNEDSGKSRPEEVAFTISYKIRNGSADESGDAVTVEATLTQETGWKKEITLPGGAFEIECLENNVPENYVKVVPSGEVAIAGDAVVSKDTDSQGNFVDKYTITNRLQRSVKLVKTAETDDSFLEGAQFELFRKTQDSFEDEDKSKAVWSLVSGNDGLIFEGPLETGSYWLRETVAPEGYVCPKEPYVLVVESGQVTLSGNGMTGVTVQIPADGTAAEIRIANKPARKTVEILKREAATEGRYLNNAKFAVYKVESEGAVDYDSLTPAFLWESKNVDGKDGVICDQNTGDPVTQLDLGVWHVVETDPPAGYAKLANSVIITVTTEGVNTSSADAVCTLQDDGAYVIEIANTKGTPLPETGGPGTIMYTLGGFAVIAASLMYGLSMRRKKRKGGMQ